MMKKCLIYYENGSQTINLRDIYLERISKYYHTNNLEHTLLLILIKTIESVEIVYISNTI